VKIVLNMTSTSETLSKLVNISHLKMSLRN